MFNKIIKQALFGVLLLSATFLQAQSVDLENVIIVHDQKERSAVKVVIAPEGKDTKKDFKDFIEDRYNVEVEGISLFKNKPVIYTEKAVISSISTQPINLYAKVIEIGQKTEIYVFGQFDNNNQITPLDHYTEYQSMRDLTVEFLERILPNYYQNIVATQVDEVADLEKDRADMEKKMDKNKKKITEMTEENEELEVKLAENAKKIEQSINKLGEKKATLKKVNKNLNKSNR